MSITTSLAAQSAIIQANRAEMDAIRANQAQQNLALSGGNNLSALSRKETALEMQKERASVQAKASRAMQGAISKRLDIRA